jgi:hypothetical protein
MKFRVKTIMKKINKKMKENRRCHNQDLKKMVKSNNSISKKKSLTRDQDHHSGLEEC